MNIYLMRHFKVDFEWKKKYSSGEFEIACEKYDRANIIKQNVELNHENAQIYLSELIRSTLTYEALEIGAKAVKTNLINEVPISPFLQTNLKIPTSVWMLMGRIQWFLNIKKQPEIRRDTHSRIRALVKKLESENEDVLLIGHGFYFSQLKRVLIKKKYVGNRKSHYKNGEIIKFHKASN